MEQFRVVDLQQHSCDLARPLTVLALRENMCKSDMTQLGENKCDLEEEEKIKTVEGQKFYVPEWKIVQE